MKAKKQIVSLNLSEAYVPNWGTWECAREQVCNAMDADKDYELISHNPNKIELITTTIPTIAELCIIGASSKRDDAEQIGQFGEGFKLSVLTALRLGGKVEVFMPGHELRFSLREVPNFDQRVLHAEILTVENSEDFCRVIVSLTAVSDVLSGRFCDRSETMVEKLKENHLRVFVKGVFIKEYEKEALWDWNLQLDLNRDRSMVDIWNIKSKIAEHLGRNGTQADFCEIMRSQKSFELNCLGGLSNWTDYKAQPEAIAAFHEVYGEKAVLSAQQDTINLSAQAKGYDVVYESSEMSGFKVPKASDIAKEHDSFEEVEIPQKFQDEFFEALETMEINAKIKLFSHESAPHILGKATVEKTIPLVWLNTNLLEPGNRAKRLATLAHELCHIDSEAGDGTQAFEYRLDELCGKLLAKLL